MFDPTANPDLAILQGGSQQNQIPQEDPASIPIDQQPSAPTIAPGETDEEIEKLLVNLLEKAEREDEDLRLRLLNIWKRNDCYFNNLQAIFFDVEAKDYRTVDNVLAQLSKEMDSDIKIINIYRPLVESIVTALTVQPPNITYMPDDAESPEDLETCKAYDKITELVQRHTHAPIMLIKMFILLVNSGVVCGHNYYKNDPAYGVVRSPKTTVPKAVPVSDVRCPQCTQLIDSNLPSSTIEQGSQITCPSCGFQGPPKIYARVEYEDEVTEWDETPKGRAGFELYGPEAVKMPLYSKDQAHLPYLVLRVEDNAAFFRTVFDDYTISPAGGDTQLYERWARIPVEYNGTIPTNITTCRYVWFRPWYYAELGETDAKKLIAKFPNGVKFAVIDKTVVDSPESANLDDEWTITFDPRSKFIHAEPHGNAIIPIQDSKTDIFNLGLQSIEYGIPETFVHPKTVNLENYKKQAKAPGMMTRALPPAPDKALSDGFYQAKTATLSNEYTTFDKNLDSLSQFVSGAMPAIWGGAVKTGESTATETTNQKAMALQRLQLMWQMGSIFWCSLLFKCTKDFAQNMREDEKYTQKKNGSYINVWINKTSLAGKVGSAEPELNGSLPQSWEQKKSFVMELIAMQNPEVGAILMHPNNAEMLKSSTGMYDIYIPGEHDRNKQYAEYYQLIMGVSPDNGMTPSVEIDIDVDDHNVHMQVLKNILVSEVGVALHEQNPDAYTNCIAHYRMHQMAVQAHTQSASGMTASGETPDSASATSQG